MDRQSQQVAPRGRPVTGKDVASALDYFEHFLNATSLKQILGYYRSICDLLNLKPNLFPLFYPKLRGHLTSWRAKALWKKFDARAGHKCYGKGKLCPNTRVLIIGAGPCGMRTAIEAQLLGAKVVVVEKRDRLSRNNVLHLWPFVIEDLRMLGAKKFFGKFCAGAIDHISIRQLQCILLKVALLLGVEVHTEVSFERLIEPNAAEKTGWKAEFKPANHPVSQFEFDVVIGADGKRNTLQGFKRKEFRGKLAIAITANFINKRTEAEARVEEISGVAFIFNQKFFKDLYEATGIDLENIVYYKDDTHYFVMTAKKHSLIDKGVIKQDLADTERLLAPDNVNREELMNYAREAANFSTNYQMPDVEFAVNHYGQSDVAMFDFTSMYAAENASKMVERNGYRLLMILVGDSLLEPFWPTGSGCARGFLSSLDAAWAIRSMNSGVMTPLDVLAERESIYRLLAQTTPDNLNKDWKAYTLDPYTRYPNLNKNVVSAHQTVALYDTDDPQSIEAFKQSAQEVAAQVQDMPKKRRRGNVDSDVLLNWISEQVRAHDDIEITDIASVFKGGKALCAILNHYRPDLLDYSSVKDSDQPAKNNQMAIDVLEKEIGISPIMTSEEITNTEDYLSMATYLTQVYDSFRCEIPHIKHPKLPNSRQLLPAKPSKHSPSNNSEWKSKNKDHDIPEDVGSGITNRVKLYAKFFSEQPATKRYKKSFSLSPQLCKKCYKYKTWEDCTWLPDVPGRPRGVSVSTNKPSADTSPKSEDASTPRTSKLLSPRLLSGSTLLSKTEIATLYRRGSRSLGGGDASVNSEDALVQSSSSDIIEDADICERNANSDGDTNKTKSKFRRKFKGICVKFETFKNELTITRVAGCDDLPTRQRCQKFPNYVVKFPHRNDNMSDSDYDGMERAMSSSRVSNWISRNDFNKHRTAPYMETPRLSDGGSDSSTTTGSPEGCNGPCGNGNVKKKMSSCVAFESPKIEERTEIIKIGPNSEVMKSVTKLGQPEPAERVARNVRPTRAPSSDPDEIEAGFVKHLSKFSHFTPFDDQRSSINQKTRPTRSYTVIAEGDELELPECRRSDTTLKSLKPTSSLVNMMHVQQAVPLNRPQSRHKRQHADVLVNKVGCSGDKKTRKRRTLERLSVSVMSHWFMNAFLETTVATLVMATIDLAMNWNEWINHL